MTADPEWKTDPESEPDLSLSQILILEQTVMIPAAHLGTGRSSPGWQILAVMWRRELPLRPRPMTAASRRILLLCPGRSPGRAVAVVRRQREPPAGVLRLLPGTAAAPMRGQGTAVFPCGCSPCLSRGWLSSWTRRCDIRIRGMSCLRCLIFPGLSWGTAFLN